MTKYAGTALNAKRHERALKRAERESGRKTKRALAVELVRKAKLHQQKKR